MRSDDLPPSENVEDRRGQDGGGSDGGGLPFGAGGLGLLGIVVVLAISYFTGISPQTLISAVQGINGGPPPVAQQGPDRAPPQQTGQAGSGTPTDASGHFIAEVLGSTEQIWTDIFQQQVKTVVYTKPSLVLFRGVTSSGCGTAQSATGPFYCQQDQKIYLDTEFFTEMRNRFNACPPGEGACAFAQAYVIAHEVGHHVQDLLGILPQIRQQQAAGDEAQANALSVRLELQADCLAGVWANRADQKWHFIQQGDVAAALQTAQAIGDDRLQRQAQGYVVPDSFTHGTSEQRQRWFSNGYKAGQISGCDTFHANPL